MKLVSAFAAEHGSVAYIINRGNKNKLPMEVPVIAWGIYDNGNEKSLHPIIAWGNRLGRPGEVDSNLEIFNIDFPLPPAPRDEASQVEEAQDPRAVITLTDEDFGKDRIDPKLLLSGDQERIATLDTLNKQLNQELAETAKALNAEQAINLDLRNRILELEQQQSINLAIDLEPLLNTDDELNTEGDEDNATPTPKKRARTNKKEAN